MRLYCEELKAIPFRYLPTYKENVEVRNGFCEAEDPYAINALKREGFIEVDRQTEPTFVEADRQTEPTFVDSVSKIEESVPKPVVRKSKTGGNEKRVSKPKTRKLAKTSRLARKK